ncbi:2-keto-4-pentenoate hydratase [Xanthobacter wiegelii]|uniref:2-keto-4-pentenoate hydratase n=1 Tax=Xanthobacter wiegelii TaxID=3119913 RepID=UPI0037291FF7
MNAVTTISSEILHQAADRLFEAARTGVPLSPVRDLIGPDDIEAAYRVQEINTKRALEAGRRLVGRKIGLTSVAVQKQLGVDQPDYGVLLDNMAVPDGGEVPPGRLIQPKAEVEVAFVLGQDLTDEHITAADMIRAVGFALPAIEIVDSRIADWRIGIVDTIADNASSALYVLGSSPRKLDAFDVSGCEMTFQADGQDVSSGSGHACLGSPISAALWLARTMARMGRPLKAGDTILSGALGPMVRVEWGRRMEAHISGLGSVRVSFATETNS